METCYVTACGELKKLPSPTPQARLLITPTTTLPTHILVEMSAPQIPNLSTFRRRGGPGRFRSRGGGDQGSDVPRGTLSKDRVVQGTDNDASVSRLSAVRLGYLEDPFAQALTPAGLETRRFPIINRGMCMCMLCPTPAGVEVGERE